MSRRGVVLWGVMGLALAAAGREALAVEQPRSEPRMVPEGEVMMPAIDDEVIVVVLLQTERMLQKTAAVGSRRQAPGDLRSTSKVLQGSLGDMVTKLERYATRKGFTAPAGLPPDATAAGTDFGRLLAGLETLRGHEFKAVYVNVVHSFLGEMVAIVAGAQEMAADPGLKSMLGGMQSDLVAHRMRFEDLMGSMAPRGITPGHGIPELRQLR